MIAGMIIAAVISVIVGIILGLGVDNMKEKHPEYKGEDFLNWDDNHTENDF